MRTRHLPRDLPRLWLMTDERMGAGLWSALCRLPRGSGVVFRHYRMLPDERRRLFGAIRRVARRRGLVVVGAGARRLRGADGVHNRLRRGDGLRTFAVHSVPDAVRARQAGADLVFVSPVFATRSHPGERVLGSLRAMRLARMARVPAVALGGLDAIRFRRLRGFWGWAGVDAWLGRENGAK